MTTLAFMGSVNQVIASSRVIEHRVDHAGAVRNSSSITDKRLKILEVNEGEARTRQGFLQNTSFSERCPSELVTIDSTLFTTLLHQLEHGLRRLGNPGALRGRRDKAEDCRFYLMLAGFPNVLSLTTRRVP